MKLIQNQYYGYESEKPSLMDPGASFFSIDTGNVYHYLQDGTPVNSEDMNAAVYDPTGVIGDAFDMDNMADGSAKVGMTIAERSKLTGIEANATADQTDGEIKTAYENNADTNAYTDAEKTKVGHISVTQAVDLDTMESDITTNNAKISLTDGSVTEAKLNAKFKGSSAVAADDVDWSDSALYTKTLGGNTVFTFSNVYIGTKMLEITGNFTLGFPAGFTTIDGSKAYDGTVSNFIEVVCTDTVTPAGWIVISQAP